MGNELKPENVIGDDPKPRVIVRKAEENQVDTYERGLKEGVELGKKLKSSEIKAEPVIAPKKDEKPIEKPVKRSILDMLGDIK